jgi:hypothetical protein
LVEGVVLGVEQFPQFLAEGFEDVGKSGESCIEDVADGLDVIDLFTALVVVDDVN